MEPALRQRLVGALVLVALAIIFVPMLVVERHPEEVTVAPVRALSAPPPMPTLRPLPDRREETDAVSSLDVPVPERLPGALRPGSDTVKTDAAPVAAGASPQSPEAEASRAAALPAPGGWVVQVASLGSKDNASTLVTELRDKGFSAFLDSAEGPNQESTYRVRIGPETTQENAKAVGERVAGLTGLEPIVLRFP